MNTDLICRSTFTILQNLGMRTPAPIQKKSDFLSVCPTSQFYPSYITNQKTGWQPFTWVTSRVLTKRVMCILESFHSSFNNSGVEFCSIAEFKNLQIINYLLNDDCEYCSQTSSKREHLKNHIKTLHQCHLNKASSCWRKYSYI